MIAASAAEFREALGASHGRLGGLDVGTKTVGLATCDASWSFATAGTTLKRGKFTADLEKLREFASENSLKGLVIGLPLNMDGSDSPQTQSVRAFARNCAPLGLPILMWDERWSTMAVERAMIDADMSRAKRETRVDSHAAAHILQGAIDALVNLPEIGEEGP